jgi:hypothetical protein
MFGKTFESWHACEVGDERHSMVLFSNHYSPPVRCHRSSLIRVLVPAPCLPVLDRIGAPVGSSAGLAPRGRIQGSIGAI